jgi:hypothetical protein
MMCGMNGNLLSRIIWTCPHQFTWPRRDESGAYYQLCVNCGSKYRYDWKRMRRTSRIEDDLPEARASHRPQKITWKVRERRIRHVVPVLYRISWDAEWIAGTSENLSRSGLLFRGPAELAAGAPYEIMLTMPPEITGDGEAEVICKAPVARVTPAAKGSKEPESFLIACAIEDYDFGKKPAGPATQQVRHQANA